MSIEIFYILLVQQLGSYFVVLLGSGLFYFVAIRRLIWSALDPLAIFFFFAAFAAAIPVFLYVQGLIETRYFVGFALSELSLLAGIWIGSGRRTKQKALSVAEQRPVIDAMQIKVLLLATLLLLLFAQTYQLQVDGLAALKEHRLEAYFSDDPVSRAANKLINALRPIAFVVSLYALMVLRQIKWRLATICNIAVVLLSYMMTGAKSSLLAPILLGYLFVRFLRASLSDSLVRMARRVALISFCTAIGFSILVVSLKVDRGFGSALLFLGARLIQGGDAFISAYPNEIVDQVTPPSFIALLSSSLSSSIDGQPVLPIGQQIFYKANGFENLEAPNAWHSIVGYLMFDFPGQLVFSLIIGLVMGGIRQVFTNTHEKGVLTGVFMIPLVLSICSLPQDPQLIIGMLSGHIACWLMLAFLVYAIAKFAESTYELTRIVPSQ